MTREEAIRYFKRHIELYCVTGICLEAEKMAIEALEQEPCEDCVSRQATAERLCKVAEFMNEKREGLGSPYVMAALFIQDNKDEFPPVTPQPKMGHWIMSDDGLYRPICNNCGAHPWKGYIPTVEEATEVFKYCPNCGAKMEVEDEESN